MENFQVYNLFIIWNVNPLAGLSLSKVTVVYNLFIIWNVNYYYVYYTYYRYSVYNLFIIWNVNKTLKVLYKNKSSSL